MIITPVAHRNKEDLVWAAGLFEGEGCFTTTSTGVASKNGKEYRAFRAQLSSTDRDVLERFHRIVGFGSVAVLKKMQPHHKTQWGWHATSFEQFQALVAFLWHQLGARRKARAKELLLTAAVYYAGNIRNGTRKRKPR